MLQELWSCFESTGDINVYLNFKEYEMTHQNIEKAGETLSMKEVK